MACLNSKVETEQIRDNMPAGLSFHIFGPLTLAAAAGASLDL